MKYLFTILLLFVGCAVSAQSPVHTDADIPTSYSMPVFSKITIFMPTDSITGGKHPVEIEMHESGTVGHYLYSDGATYDSPTGASIEKGGTQITSTNAKYGGTSSWIIVKVHLPSGSNAEMARIKDAYNYMRAHYSTYMDTTQVYASGLSLGGKPILDLMQEDSAVWRHRFAAYASMAAVQGNISTNSGIVSNINTDSIHYRLYWCDDDNSNGGAPQTQNTNLMTLQFGFGNQLHTYKVEPIVPMTGGHSGSWTLAYETGHTTVTNGFDSSWYRGNSTVTANQNKTYTHNPNLWEWFLTFNNPAFTPGSPPSCVTNVTPANSSTSPYAATADLTWNYAGAGTLGYDLYFYTGSPPGSPTVSNINALTYHMTGLTGSTAYKWFVVPKNSAGSATGCSSNFTTFTTAPPGTIDSLMVPANYYDISGASTYSYNQPKDWWDSYGAFNPLIGATTDPSNTWGLTNGNAEFNQDRFYQHGTNNGINYPNMNRGQLILFDMLDRIDPLDTSRMAIIRRLSFISNMNAGDTMFIYDLTKQLILKPANQIDSLIAHFPQGMVAFDSVVTNGFGNFIDHPLATPQRLRWLGIRCTASGTNTSGFSEIAIIGQMTNSTIGTVYVMPSLNSVIKYDSSTIKTSNAINIREGNDIVGLAPFGGLRPFINSGGGGWAHNPSNFNDSTWNGQYYDTSRAYIGSNLNPLTFWNNSGTSDMTVPYLRSAITAGKDLIVTWAGSSGYNASVGYAYVDIDSPGVSHPEVPKSWIHHGKVVRQFIMRFGSNTDNTGSVWVGNGSYSNGLNIPIKSGFSNENDSHGLTPWASAVKKSVEWDGDEGRACSPCGIKDADSTFQLLSDATAECDTNLIKIYTLRNKLVRSDHKTHITGIDHHHYWHNKERRGNDYGYSDYVGIFAVPFEWAFRLAGLNGVLWDRLIVATDNKYQPGIRVTKSESDGISSDTAKIYVETQSDIGNHEIYINRIIGSLTPEQSRSLMINRNFVEALWSGFAKQYYYEYQKLVTTPSNHALFGKHGITDSVLITYPFATPIVSRDAAYNSIAGITSATSRYRKEPGTDLHVLTGNDSTGVWMSTYRNIYSPDSVCVELHKASLTGATQTVTVTFPNNITGPVTHGYPSFTDTTLAVNSLTGSGNTLTSQVIDENTNFYFAKEAAGTPPAALPPKTIYRGKIIKHS